MLFTNDFFWGITVGGKNPTGEVPMAIDIKDTTMSVDPKSFKIPTTSAYYKVRAMGRRALPEQFNELFVASFDRACGSAKRDYRNLYDNVLAEVRNQTSSSVSKQGSVFESFKQTWGVCCSDTRSFEKAAELYCTIFAAAIKSCPVTEEDIYE